MRRLSFDQFEFDPPSSEESLDLAVSSGRQHSSLAEFLAECGSSAPAGTPLPAGWSKWEWVASVIGSRAGVELPSIEECRIVMLSDDWNDVELAIVVGWVLIWFQWWTTA